MGILTDDMKRVVTEQRLGFVATACLDGRPNLSPKGTTAVWDDDHHLIFADMRSPGTVANLRQNPALEITVVDQVVRKGYRFKGTAEVLTEGPIFEQALAFYRERGGQNPVRAIVVMKVERALPLTSPAYDPGLERERGARLLACLLAVTRGGRGGPSDGPVVAATLRKRSAWFPKRKQASFPRHSLHDALHPI